MTAPNGWRSLYRTEHLDRSSGTASARTGTASSRTCQHPGGDHKYQSQYDDESDENPCVAEALFGLLLRVTASLDLTRSPDCAGRRVANLLIDAQGNRSGIEIRHEMKTSKRVAMFRGRTGKPRLALRACWARTARGSSLGNMPLPNDAARLSLAKPPPPLHCPSPPPALVA